MPSDPSTSNFLNTPKGMAASILAPALLGGGAMGYMASQTPDRPGEDKQERRRRIIRHALAGAVAGGGVGGLGNYAMRSADTAMPPMGEFEKKWKSKKGRGKLIAGGAGLGAGLSMFGKMKPKEIEALVGERNLFGKSILPGAQPGKWVKGLSNQELLDLDNMTRGGAQHNAKLREIWRRKGTWTAKTPNLARRMISRPGRRWGGGAAGAILGTLAPFIGFDVLPPLLQGSTGE